MSYKPHFEKGSAKLPLLIGLALLLALALIGIKTKAPNPDLQNRVHNMVKEMETISRMRVDLLKSVDIEKAAVMADTDELSRALAEQSLDAAREVERGRIELKQLAEADRAAKETALLQEFDACWAELQKIDKVLLEFAVENSNIKAASLSFTQGAQVINFFKHDLSDLLAKSASSPNYCKIQKLASEALAAGFEIHYLHAPHIAAANDKEMDKIEAEIAQLNGVIRSSLKEIETCLPEAHHPLLENTVAAYDDFERISAEVLRLSRQNTNIKSFELSLGRKRKVTAQCDETLAALTENIRSRTFEATR